MCKQGMCKHGTCKQGMCKLDVSTMSVHRAGRAEAEQGSLGDATRLMISALSYYEAAAEQDSGSIQLLVRSRVSLQGSSVSLLRTLLSPCCTLPSSWCPLLSPCHTSLPPCHQFSCTAAAGHLSARSACDCKPQQLCVL